MHKSTNTLWYKFYINRIYFNITYENVAVIRNSYLFWCYQEDLQFFNANVILILLYIFLYLGYDPGYKYLTFDSHLNLLLSFLDSPHAIEQVEEYFFKFLAPCLMRGFVQFKSSTIWIQVDWIFNDWLVIVGSTQNA